MFERMGANHNNNDDKKAIPRRLCFADAALKKQIKEMDNYNFPSTVSVGLQA